MMKEFTVQLAIYQKKYDKEQRMMIHNNGELDR